MILNFWLIIFLSIISFACLIFVIIGYSFFYSTTRIFSVLIFLCAFFTIPCLIRKNRITNFIAKPSIYILWKTRTIGDKENINIITLIGTFLHAGAIFLLSCLDQDIYRGVLIGILSGCIISIVIYCTNYINERLKFILYTREKLKNILVQIINIKFFLKKLHSYTSNDNIYNKCEFEKIPYSKQTDYILEKTNELSNSMQALNSKISSYTDLSVTMSSLITILKGFKSEKIDILCDKIYKTKHNGRMELLLKGIYSEIECSPSETINMAHKIHINFVDMKIYILNIMKDGEKDYLLNEKLNSIIFELKQNIEILDCYFSQRIDGIRKTMGLFSKGTDYAAWWNEYEKELDDMLTKNDSCA